MKKPIKLRFQCNIDVYSNINRSIFSVDLLPIPRVGESVVVDTVCDKTRIPFNTLEVKNVTYDYFSDSDYEVVIVELHYSDFQIKQAQSYYINLYP